MKWIGVAEARHCERESESRAEEMKSLRETVLRRERETPKVTPVPAKPYGGPPVHDFTLAFDMDEDELEKTRQAAVHGDARASGRIYEYYSFGYNQFVEGWFWMRLAAEQGDCRVAVDYAFQVLGPMRNPSGAVPWVDRVVEMGCEKEPAVRKDLDLLRETLRSRNAIE